MTVDIQCFARYRDDERGASTIEYTMVLGFMSVISIYATIGLINVLKSAVAVLVIKMAIFLTGFPRSSFRRSTRC